MVAAMVESASTHMVASAPSSSESAEDACSTKMSLFRGQRRWYEMITVHWPDARARLAVKSHITHVGWLDGPATRRRRVSTRSRPQSSSLTSRLSAASTRAGLSRHDDIERTSLMLPIVVAMYRPGVCVVSHHRCASEGFGGHR